MIVFGEKRKLLPDELPFAERAFAAELVSAIDPSYNALFLAARRVNGRRLIFLSCEPLTGEKTLRQQSEWRSTAAATG